MELAIRDSAPVANVPLECAVCSQRAYGKNYGVISCDACKMFFRRVSKEKLTYKCKATCAVQKNDKCKACRFRKCVAEGMVFTSNRPTVKIRNEKIDELNFILRELKSRDNTRQKKLNTFYSLDDPVLEDILRNPNAVNRYRKSSNHVVTPNEWAFLALYSHMNYFLNFGFVQTISIEDQKIIFQYNTLKLTYFCGLMRTLNESRLKMLSPGGQEIYPDDLIQHYRNTPYNLAKICSEPVSKMIALKMTNEEFQLLNLIFFCIPATMDISENARKILATNQDKYYKALVQYCEINYQKNSPTRLVELYSLYETITKNSEIMENLFMMFHLESKYGFKKLVRDTFHF